MNANWKKGFTLIELMMTIAIIAIIAAIAIPNLMRSRMAANEAAAVTVVKSYATAQVTFQVSQEGALATNTNAGLKGYCDNFRNLYYGNPSKDPNSILKLISRAFANAFARDPAEGQAATRSSPVVPDGMAPYQGFLFGEPKELLASPKSFETTFALLAVPTQSSVTGDNAFWIGTEGNVKVAGLNKNSIADTSIDMDTPSNPTETKWIGL